MYYSVVAGDRKHTCGLVYFQGFLFYFNKQLQGVYSENLAQGQNSLGIN